MRISLVFLSIIVSALVAGATGFAISKLPRESLPFIPTPTPIPTPLARYEIENLITKEISEGKIEITEAMPTPSAALEKPKFTSYIFKHSFDPRLENLENKVVTGQINVPIASKETPDPKFPLVLMIRGYVDQSIYETGIGTRNGAAYFAENGFITIAPDFLGYAGSSSEAGDIFETRFQTYTTVLSIFSSLQSIKGWDGKNVFIWAHSNGGQVALTVLSITGEPIPTTLWAPVTKPFPYSVLYYTDESVDGGKFIRTELAEFEKLYDVDKYSFINYIDKIKAPLQVQQGTGDDAIPVEWSDNFVAKMGKLELEVEYFKYPGADHNMRPAWDTVVARDLEFFRKHMDK